MEPVKNALTKPRKRTQAEKIGRHKYTLQLLHRLIKMEKDNQATLRYLCQGLRDFLTFDRPYVQQIVCEDEVDSAILDTLRHAGQGGMLPRDVADKLKQYKLKPWHVSRRLCRMNNRLRKQIDQTAAEKRGGKRQRWALTDFMYKAWESTKEEIWREEKSSTSLSS
jgi:hypothetical protein